MFERNSVFFASKIAALKIEQFLDHDFEHILDPTSVDPNFSGVAVLENNSHKLVLDNCVAPVDMPPSFHVFTHRLTLPLPKTAAAASMQTPFPIPL